jgi:site-specific recombinase XerD
VKSVKQLGVGTGNWLNRDQARLLLEKSDGESLRSTRDVAMIIVILAIRCGLRRCEVLYLLHVRNNKFRRTNTLNATR